MFIIKTQKNDSITITLYLLVAMCNFTQIYTPGSTHAIVSDFEYRFQNDHSPHKLLCY